MAKKRSAATRRAESQAAAARAAAIREQQARRERRVRVLVIAAVLVVVAVVATLLVTKLSQKDASAVAPAGAVASYAVPAGSATAPVKVAIYEDFMCPFCGDFESASRAQLQDDIDNGRVQLQFHVLNFLDGSSTTKYSTRAANALAVVLNASGATVAKKFHDLLYEHQPKEGGPGLSDDQLLDYAVEAGASRAVVTKGITSQAYKGWVTAVTDEASKSKVNSTPTVKIDGKTAEFTTTKGLVSAVQKAVDAG